MKREDLPSVKKIVSFIGYAIAIAFVAIVGMYIFNASKVGNIVDTEKSTSIIGYKPVIVVTGSMEPAIKVNSISLLEYCSIKDLEPGDTVMYKYNNMRITHRVTDIGVDTNGEIYLITKGDANKYQDVTPITAEMVEGKLIRTYNGVAPYISHFMLSPGEINSAAVSQGILFLIVFVGLAGIVIFHLGNLIHTIAIIVTNRKKYKEYMEDYKELNNRQLTLEEELKKILESDSTSVMSLMYKAKAIKGINELKETMKDFEKRMRFIRFLRRVFYKPKH